MVVQAVIALALALPTGALFGVGYGTGVRIGYEQIYPLLFPAGKRPDPSQTQENIKSINNIYNAIGGKEASQMGIGKGLSDAMSSLNKNPDFQALAELELKLSGNMRSSSDRGADFKTSSDTLQDTSYSDLQEQVADKQTDRETQWREAKQLLSSFEFQKKARTMSLEELSYWLRNKTKFNLISETINVLNFYKQQKLKTLRESGEIIPSTKDTTSAPTAPELSSQSAVNAYQTKKIQLFQIVKTAWRNHRIKQNEFNGYNSVRTKQQIVLKRLEAELQKLKNIYRDRKQKYYNYITQQRNSSDLRVKQLATQDIRIDILPL